MTQCGGCPGKVLGVVGGKSEHAGQVEKCGWRNMRLTLEVLSLSPVKDAVQSIPEMIM